MASTQYMLLATLVVIAVSSVLSFRYPQRKDAKIGWLFVIVTIPCIFALFVERPVCGSWAVRHISDCSGLLLVFWASMCGEGINLFCMSSGLSRRKRLGLGPI